MTASHLLIPIRTSFFVDALNVSPTARKKSYLSKKNQKKKNDFLKKKNNNKIFQFSKNKSK
jgi:hypothetical protein